MPSDNKKRKVGEKNETANKEEWLEKPFRPGDDLKRQKSKSPNGALLNILTDNSTHFVDEAGEKQPVKTSVSLSKKDVSAKADLDQVEADFLKVVADKVKTYRPITSPRNKETGSPKAIVYTPNKTALYRYADYGVLTVFASHANPSSKKVARSLEKSFLQSDNYAAVKKPEKDVKEIAVSFTKKEIEENKENLNPNRNQNSVVIEEGFKPQDGSATQYFAAAMMPSTQEKKPIRNWGHMDPYQVNGEKTQNIKNFINISNSANTRQLNIEDHAIKLTNQYPSVDYRLKAELHPDTHIPKHDVTGSIATDKFNFNVKFDPDATEKPRREEFIFMGLFSQSIVKAHKPTKEAPSLIKKI